MTSLRFLFRRSVALRFSILTGLTTVVACSAGMAVAAQPEMPQERAVTAASGEGSAPVRWSDREGDRDRPRTPNAPPQLERRPPFPVAPFMSRSPGGGDEQFRSLERILESPLLKRYIELVETNAKLRAQLEIQEHLAHRERELEATQRHHPGSGRDLPRRDMPGREHPEREHADHQHAMRAHAEREHAEREHAEREHAEREHAEREHAERDRAQGAGRRDEAREASEVDALRRRVRELEARIRELTSRRDQPGPRPEARGDRRDQPDRDTGARSPEAQKKGEPRRDREVDRRDREGDREVKRDGDRDDREGAGKDKNKDRDDEDEDDDDEEDD